MTPPSHDPEMAPNRNGSFPGPPARVRETHVVLLALSKEWVCPDGVWRIKYFRFAAPGGGGGSSSSATIGGGAGSSGQSAVGELYVVPGARYVYTQGATGLGGDAAFGNRNGSDGGDSSFVGPGVNLSLRGGKAGLGDGTGGVAVGTSATSPLGYQVFAGAAGGSGNTGAPGAAGGASDLMLGGLAGGGNNSGGGGGSTPFGRGGTGGVAGYIGLAPTVAESGAGGGGSGAGDGASGFGGANGAPGFLRLWYDQ